MIKVRLYSDIHLDWYVAKGVPFWYPPELPDDKDTILVLAGDLWIGTEFIKWAEFSWIEKVARRFKKVLIVLGNHDYWPQGNLTIMNGGAKVNTMLQDMDINNVQCLDMNTYLEGEFLFVGATLWTDMNKYDPLTMHLMSRAMTYDGKCVFDNNGTQERFSSEKWVETFKKHRDYISHVVSQNKDKKIIIVTHHIPLLNLNDPIYVDSSDNGYYMSDLSDIILDNDHIVSWMYGHTHYPMDRMFPNYEEEGGCRMINNSLGYLGESKKTNSVKHEVINFE